MDSNDTYFVDLSGGAVALDSLDIYYRVYYMVESEWGFTSVYVLKKADTLYVIADDSNAEGVIAIVTTYYDEWNEEEVSYTTYYAPYTETNVSVGSTNLYLILETGENEYTVCGIELFGYTEASEEKFTFYASVTTDGDGRVTLWKEIVYYSASGEECGHSENYGSVDFSEISTLDISGDYDLTTPGVYENITVTYNGTQYVGTIYVEE